MLLGSQSGCASWPKENILTIIQGTVFYINLFGIFTFITINQEGKLLSRRAEAGRFYLRMQSAVIREGLSTTNIGAVILQSRNTVLDRILQLLHTLLYHTKYLPVLYV